ncbi:MULTISPECIES: NAD(P) transhydrogenase subunit alpha [Pseudofrankia]|uniref:NAD(P) transhydrogenase subunit alpha n=1 Tax=Pseudofrankia TaxID=2994363 RepID=UPI000234C187|nr:MULTISPECIES: NAD(P) transhydrogenase subunit alpha [Pseudofrankia]OHV41352.1 NAD/NADP transhydrogenase subunit alpha [Pseudofrankia sp. EUN1h]
MSAELVNGLTVLVLSLLVGFEVVGKVPSTLHTPLMSGANAIHGIVIIGVMIVAAGADSPLGYVLVFVAAAFAAANVVGGYVVTDRMLEMFRRRPTVRAGDLGGKGAGGEGAGGKDAGDAADGERGPREARGSRTGRP